MKRRIFFAKNGSKYALKIYIRFSVKLLFHSLFFSSPVEAWARRFNMAAAVSGTTSTRYHLYKIFATFSGKNLGIIKKTSEKKFNRISNSIQSLLEGLCW